MESKASISVHQLRTARRDGSWPWGARSLVSSTMMVSCLTARTWFCDVSQRTPTIAMPSRHALEPSFSGSLKNENQDDEGLL